MWLTPLVLPVVEDVMKDVTAQVGISCVFGRVIFRLTCPIATQSRIALRCAHDQAHTILTLPHRRPG